ncbi:hypothetical protein [Roseibacillus ishigakijimensis]|uniref:Uncharacterized protein n=1 Tax=Roseibacillus ishigakijimensis TaxID=454146 RepID=A0A934RQG3_9BACT|nr:hypothetical protein [Roseibacillus ishigakijimensis]MBK1833578.1 hypothetical protein [Roseibacillus ishigakijimensis]
MLKFLFPDPMNSSRRTLFLSLAALLGLALGATLRHWGSSPADTASAHTASQHEQSRVPQTLGPTRTTRLLREISQWDSEQCEEFILAEILNPAASEAAKSAAFLRWLELAGTEAVLTKFGGPRAPFHEQPGLIFSFFDAWLVHDEEAAMNPEHYSSFHDLRVRAALERTPLSVPQLIENGQSSLSHNHSAHFEGFQQAGKLGEPFLDALIAAKSEALIHPSILGPALQGWAHTDPEAAMTWIDEQAFSETFAFEAKKQVLHIWAEKDFMAARKVAVTLTPPEPEGGMPNPFLRWPNTSTRTLLSQPDNPGVRLAYAHHSDPFLTVTEAHEFLSDPALTWGDEPPTVATPHPHNHNEALDRDGWFPANPAELLPEAEALPPGRARDLILRRLLNTLLVTDPTLAVAKGQELGVDTAHLATERATPPPELLAKIESNPELLLESLFNEKVEELATVSDQQVLNYAQLWARDNPVRAAYRIAEEGVQRVHGVSRDSELFLYNTLGPFFARQDPIGSLAWLETLPPEDARLVFPMMTYDITNYAPHEIFQLGTEIFPPGERIFLSHALAETMRRNGEYSARMLLQSPALTPQERAEFTEKLFPSEPSQP